MEGGDYLTLTFSRPEEIDDLNYYVEASGDLLDWPDAAIKWRKWEEGNGMTKLSYRDVQSIHESTARYMRLRVALFQSQ